MYPKNQLANTLVVSLAHAVVGGIVHYPPNITNINSIEFVLNGTGAPGMPPVLYLIIRVHFTNTSVLADKAYTTRQRPLMIFMASTTGATCLMFA